MLAFFMFALFAFGLVVGSFLNVVISRLGSAQSPLRGRSRCDHCGRTLQWFELIPLFSFAIQKGRCRSCRTPIAVRHLYVELITAFLFLTLGLAVIDDRIFLPRFGAEGAIPGGNFSLLGPAAFIYFAFFAAAAVAISFYDLEFRIIPRGLTWPLIAVGSAVLILAAAFSRDYWLLLQGLGAGLLAFAFFWAIWFFSKGKAMGRGDADVALAIALYLEPPAALAGFVLAFWIGSILSLALLILGRLSLKSQIPFAPFLFAGALAALFVPASALVHYFF